MSAFKVTGSKLTAAVKRRWVAALRSGKYEQGIEYLRSRKGEEDPRDCARMLPQDQFCCLGVLCEVTGLRTKERKIYGDQKHQKYFLGSVPASTKTVTFANWLAIKNDEGTSFAEIADLIEEYL